MRVSEIRVNQIRVNQGLSYITGTREMVASIGRILSIPKVKNGLA